VHHSHYLISAHPLIHLPHLLLVVHLHQTHQPGLIPSLPTPRPNPNHIHIPIHIRLRINPNTSLTPPLYTLPTQHMTNGLRMEFRIRQDDGRRGTVIMDVSPYHLHGFPHPGHHFRIVEGCCRVNAGDHCDFSGVCEWAHVTVQPFVRNPIHRLHLQPISENHPRRVRSHSNYERGLTLFNLLPQHLLHHFPLILTHFLPVIHTILKRIRHPDIPPPHLHHPLEEFVKFRSRLTHKRHPPPILLHSRCLTHEHPITGHRPITLHPHDLTHPSSPSTLLAPSSKTTHSPQSQPYPPPPPTT